MFKLSSTLLVLLLALALITIGSEAASPTTGSANTKACLRKMAAYVNAICDGREFTKNVEEVIVSACNSHVNIEQFIDQICPDV